MEVRVLGILHLLQLLLESYACLTHGLQLVAECFNGGGELCGVRWRRHGGGGRDSRGGRADGGEGMMERRERPETKCKSARRSTLRCEYESRRRCGSMYRSLGSTQTSR